MIKKKVFINCNEKYIPKAIIALEKFYHYNKDFDKSIICTQINSELESLCKQFNIEVKKINLYNDFINLENRKEGLQYPIECFYHFYAYKIYPNYDYLIQIEPDIYTNKKLDVNFKSIDYIAGSYTKGFLIKNFASIKKDLKKIKLVYNNCHINEPRILSGVKIYNVKGLIKINFYETIIKYYKKCLEINAVRNGDDSLMVMYHMLNPRHITLLDPVFHVVIYRKIYNYKNITFFHFTGPTKKYWKINNYSNDIVKFFYDNIIEFIYNNFDINYIKKYLPEKYLDISNIKIPFYYFKEIENFGDLITPYFLKKFCNKNDYTFVNDNNIPKIISCGSIMRLCDNNTIVYGSGIRDRKQDINKGIIKIVRGPITRKRLLEINAYCPEVYGDPGILLPLYYNPSIKKKYKLGIIPHYIHYNKIKKMYKNNNNFKIINLINSDIEFVIKEILSCEKIISSSLHGLIVSDAYNIPNKWIKFNDKINGDDTKYYDYFQSVERKDIEYIDCDKYKQIPKNILNLIKNVNIKFDKQNLKNKMFFDENGIKNYTKYLYKKLLIKNKNILNKNKNKKILIERFKNIEENNYLIIYLLFLLIFLFIIKKKTKI